MAGKNDSSRLNPEIWKIQSKVVKLKAVDLDRQLKAVMKKYHEPIDENHDSPESQ